MNKAILNKTAIWLFTAIMTALIGYLLWMVLIQDMAPQSANIKIDGNIDGKPFLLFASSRLQRGMPSVVMIQHGPLLVGIRMIPRGSHNVQVNFSYVIRHGYAVNGKATIPRNTLHGVHLPISNARSNLKIMVIGK